MNLELPRQRRRDSLDSRCLDSLTTIIINTVKTISYHCCEQGTLPYLQLLLVRRLAAWHFGFAVVAISFVIRADSLINGEETPPPSDSGSHFLPFFCFLRFHFERLFMRSHLIHGFRYTCLSATHTRTSAQPPGEDRVCTHAKTTTTFSKPHGGPDIIKYTQSLSLTAQTQSQRRGHTQDHSHRPPTEAAKNAHKQGYIKHPLLDARVLHGPVPAVIMR